ncbi:uncharacterized protein LOC119373637 [Rhipicephalus sanguineus]|uniref:uncharacterized protein LOC119373637 n=1 Tax=Rhipicephalus sanguineus TaxID=34632 RepID=UPI001893673B|nr:uncharacterized protein LOC119373637 [Rhipicephalus sanguineus]
MCGSCLFTVAVCAALVSSTLSDCVTYGYCGTDYATGKRLPCAIKRAPGPIRSDYLEDACLELLDTKSQTALACCSSEQAEVFKSEFKKLIYLGVRRGSECFKKFQNVVCQALCSPFQSHFVAVFANRTEGNKCPNPSATEIVYAVERSYAEAVYDTCKDVRTHIFGRKLMNYMCGSYGVRHCTAQHFLDFVGAVRSEGGHSPLKIRYVLTELPISVDGRTLTPFKPDLDLIAQKSNAGVQLRQYAK